MSHWFCSAQMKYRLRQKQEVYMIKETSSQTVTVLNTTLVLRLLTTLAKCPFTCGHLNRKLITTNVTIQYKICI